MTWHVIHLEDAAPILWKNGGGTTRELVAWPQANDWLWRMSVAEVTQNGPFSRFEGVDRWFSVLEGDGVALSTHGERHRLTADSAPLRFDGGLATDCELLGGPTRDFNLMTRAGAATATMTRVQGHLSLSINATEIIAIYSISTGTSARFDSESMSFTAHSLAWWVAVRPQMLELDAGQALVIRIMLAGATRGGGTNPSKETT
jgi:environmental stress-induced protein Ves